MRSTLSSVCLLFAYLISAQPNYQNYHQQVIIIEKQIVKGQYDIALDGYKELLETFPFIFIRDIKVASQLAAITNDDGAAIHLLNIGIQKGWKKNEIRKVKLLSPYLKNLSFKAYGPPDSQSFQFIDSLFRKDQKMALKALIRLKESAKQKFYDEQFAPHSNQQLIALIHWLEKNPWPGEQTTGTGVMASTIVSHHNSISKTFNDQDTLFQNLRLTQYVSQGQLSPFHYALMHDWRHAINSQSYETYYGFMGVITDKEHLNLINQHRAAIGMRSITLRNELVALEKRTSFNFFLPGSPWQTGEIQIE